MTSARTVLIPSDDFDFVANFADGYRKLGIDVSAGRINFELECRRYDIVHLLWPEELTGWRQPTSLQIDEVLARLDRWAQHSRIIISVNNLYPHRYDRDPAFHRLYASIYERADVIHHFSNASMDSVIREFPSIAARNHIVRIGFNYERLLPAGEIDRLAARRSFGFATDDIVFLAFGALRFWEEALVLSRAFELANVPRKKLLLAAQYPGYGSSWTQRVRRWQWRHWQKSEGVKSLTERIPDAQLANLFAAADAVVVIRQNSMSSGLPSMAMTFGRFVIAPDFGAMAEYLSGTDNIVYNQFSPQDLAVAMERAAIADRERVGGENARIAAKWGWEAIVRSCLDALTFEDRDHRKQFAS
jgi:glycosyltransferase involved in cell wall biosynthesis